MDNIEIKNGKGSFFSNQIPAWHRLGVVVDGALTIEEAMDKANLNFKVFKEQNVHPRTGEQIDSYSIYREDNDAFLGNVGARYTVVQNGAILGFMDKILGEGGAHYETAGVLGKGERIFATAKLQQTADIHGTGDKHELYLAGIGAHDGSMGVRLIATDIRIVCQNTLQMALNASKGSGVRVKHTANAEAKMNENLLVLQRSAEQFKSLTEKLEFLAERKFNGERVARTMADIFNVDLNKEVPTKTQNTILTIKDLFESNDDDAFPEFRGTGYNLFNAFTEFVDHYKPVRVTNGRQEMEKEVIRAESAMFGDGASYKLSVLDKILSQAEDAPQKSLHRVYSVPVEAAKADPLGAILSQYDNN